VSCPDSCRFCRYVIPAFRFLISHVIPVAFWALASYRAYVGIREAWPAQNAVTEIARYLLAGLVGLGALWLMHLLSGVDWRIRRRRPA
jgi:hypothetical protein